MRLPDLDALEPLGLTLYQRRALAALMLCGVADAATLCREGTVPTSKIYLAMEKLTGLGPAQSQPTRPKMLVEGFQELWRKAMRSLREVGADPRGHESVHPLSGR